MPGQKYRIFFRNQHRGSLEQAQDWLRKNIGPAAKAVPGGRQCCCRFLQICSDSSSLTFCNTLNFWSVSEPQNIEQGITNVEGKLHDSTFLVRYSTFVFKNFKYLWRVLGSHTQRSISLFLCLEIYSIKNARKTVRNRPTTPASSTFNLLLGLTGERLLLGG